MAAVDQRRAELRRKYLSLGLGELVAAVLFASLAFINARQLADRDAQAALWSALTPLLVILVQAGIYWLLARSWVGRRPMPAGLVALYRTFRPINALILLVGLIGVSAWAPDDALVAALVFAVWTFGVIEFVNYFIVRLAYPPSQWLSRVGQRQTPRLVLDMTDRSQANPE